MHNPLFQQYGQMPQLPNQMGNILQMKQQLQQFAQNFRGNPREEVQKLLQSGRITQQQLDQMQQFAQFLK